MMRKTSVVSRPQDDSEVKVLRRLVQDVGGIPSFDFKWKTFGEKRRLVGRPNRPMRSLHELFGAYLHEKILAMKKDGRKFLRFPSATGCVMGSNPLKNAKRHARGQFFYITDFSRAYPRLDLERLTALLVFILKYDYYGVDYSPTNFARNELAQFAMRGDILYVPLLSFVKMAFGGMYGEGLAVGGNLSPYLLNLYCEAFLDSRLREKFAKAEDKLAPERTITYTRYVDDLVFSRGILISSDTRREIRSHIEEAGFEINDRKSRVLARKMGTVFVTKQGLSEPQEEKPLSDEGTEEPEKNPSAVLVFPQKKRRRIHGIIGSYLTPKFWNDAPEVVRGLIAEFLHYHKNVETKTKTDAKTFALCKQFLEASNRYRRRYNGTRARR